MLDVIAAAAWETRDMVQIKANLQKHFKPTVVKTALIERVLGPIAKTASRRTTSAGRS